MDVWPDPTHGKCSYVHFKMLMFENVTCLKIISFQSGPRSRAPTGGALGLYVSYVCLILFDDIRVPFGPRFADEFQEF